VPQGESRFGRVAKKIRKEMLTPPRKSAVVRREHKGVKGNTRSHSWGEIIIPTAQYLCCGGRPRRKKKIIPGQKDHRMWERVQVRQGGKSTPSHEWPKPASRRNPLPKGKNLPKCENDQSLSGESAEKNALRAKVRRRDGLQDHRHIRKM